MKTSLYIGQIDNSIPYRDRPTVKCIIVKDGLVLILNNGLLPGGGVDTGESHGDALRREIQEELGMTICNAKKLRTIIQYRNFLHKRYIIDGYVAELDSTNGLAEPQDEGEAQFTPLWLHVDDAIQLIEDFILVAKEKPMNNDANQGRLYNLLTSYELLKQLRVE